jgi:manganese transport protein
MRLLSRFKNRIRKNGTLTLLKYIGPGFLVTVGFIDPGNWAANVAAGAGFGYRLLWMVTLSTLMLILLQHNAAHLGIATGLCLSEASSTYFPGWVSRSLMSTAMAASVSTALAELLGAAIGLNMLFRLPLPLGVILSTLAAAYMLLFNNYRRLEKWILAFVSLVAFSFLYELSLVTIHWPAAMSGWVLPAFPRSSLPIIMSVLGAVVMPHNIFLHSEIIQSRQWNLKEDRVIRKQLRFEFLDTLLAMLAGWAINSAMIIMAASVFFSRHIAVTELPQAEATLRPLLGSAAAIVFALALLFSGFSSSITAGMAGGSIFAGIFKKPFAMDERRSRQGVFITLGGGLLAGVMVRNPFQGLLWSQIILSIQLPLTVFLLIFLTSSRKVMGKYATPAGERFLLWTVATVISILNIMLLVQILHG